MEIAKAIIVGVLLVLVLTFTRFAFMPHPTKYFNETLGFQITVPDNFITDRDEDLTLDKDIPGVKFRVPVVLTLGTNLSPDSHIAVETLLGDRCVAQDFFYPAAITNDVLPKDPVTPIHTSFTGNQGDSYEEWIYVIPKVGRCYAIRYFIHSTDPGADPSGATKKFDRSRVIDLFDSIASSLRIY